MQCFPNLAVNSLSIEHLTGLCFHWTTSGKHCPMLYLCNLFRIFHSPNTVRHRTGQMFYSCRNVISCNWQICTPSDDFYCNFVDYLICLIIFRNVQVKQYKMTMVFFFACFEFGCDIDASPITVHLPPSSQNSSY